MQDLNDKVTGNSLTAAEWNQVPSEIQNVIAGLGITLSEADLNQLGKAIAGYVANGQFYVDSGAADAYVLAPVGSKQAPPAYTAGMMARFVAANTNTGASTINLGGLGVVNIKLEGGTSDPAAGDIESGREIALVYRTAPSAHFELLRDTSRIVEFTASGSWTKPAGLKYARVIAIAGGGGAAEGNSGQRGGGGGGAGYAIVTVPAASLAASETVTVGAGGSGGVGAGVSGGNGGTTSFGTLAIAAGGGGGSATAGGVGGSGTTGDSTATGNDGSDSDASGGSADGGSAGGTGGGGGRSGNPSGNPGRFPGGAGGGGVGGSGGGGAGADGVVIVEEFF